MGPSAPYRLIAAGLAVLTALVVLYLAHDLFPYHSSNHDEGVYLQQAAMLLEGRLFLTPESEPLREAFHPWFFVESPRGLYPKYSPVPAAVFALGKLAGGFRLALAAVAAVNVALGYAVASAAFDRRTGVVAAATLAGAPLFLITSSVFLPYAPTTALNLGFAVTYVRSVRRRSRPYAVLAGIAVGLAFFARPYTALLFAAPFVIHALWRLQRVRLDDRDLLVRTALTAVIGLGFVGLTFAYNAVVTGSALVFPYQAFAPLDGLGFGRRAILGNERLYTPALAARANALVLWAFLTDWFTAGPVGSLAAGLGGILVVRELRGRGIDVAEGLSTGQLRLLLLGVVASVAAGNLLFWGNLNLLGDLARDGDGFVARFGPFYHFDLLIPLAAFAAHGTVAGVDGLRTRLDHPSRTVSLAVVVVLVATVPIVGAAQAAALGPPLERNAAHTGKYEQAYAPFESTDTTGGLVFLPPAFGEWRNHPFQWLRNAPGFDGPTVYALSRGPGADFAVIDAYPDRTYFRYRYHGTWTPDASDRVIPVLESVRRVERRAITARTTVAVPDRVIAISVALATDDGLRRYDYEGSVPTTLAVTWTVAADGVSVDHPDLVVAGSNPDPLPIDGPSELSLAITLTEPAGGTLTYREELRVRPTSTGIEVLWPPASTACPLVTSCGLSGTYVPDRPDTRPSGTAMNTTLVGGSE